MKKSFLILSLAALMFAACKKETEKQPLNPATPTTSHSANAAREGEPIILTGDVLNFKTQEDFDNLILSLEENQTEYTYPGFTSLYTTYFNTMYAEQQAAEDFGAGYPSREDALANKDLFQHSQLYNANSDIIVYKTFDNGEQYPNMNIYSITLSKLVNKYGFVIIADKLFRYTGNKIYYTSTFDSPQTFNLSNTPNGGLLDGYIDVPTQPQPENGTTGSNCECNKNRLGVGFADRNLNIDLHRVVLTVFFVQTKMTPANQLCYNYSQMIVSGVHLYKNWLIGWSNYHTSGTVSMTFQGNYTSNRAPAHAANVVLLPNPFTKNIPNCVQSTFTHFLDQTNYNNSYLPCLDIYHAHYSLSATVGGNFIDGPASASW